ncbi:alpha-amylase family glycosyl hydrolase [Methanosarcina sp. UBA289]|uniref:alpha-amylase family glycosyl hydrolase n=1 Tax=Methanosarcina sp. UBA289 TaxID=1915574 RepID=UPI0025D18148|nr:alpha-amylase family glycosyl hydrolase [Methanosarcina sp. UBA289]
MNKQVTQDDVIYFIVTDRFFGKNKRVADPSDTSIHGGTLDGIIEKLDYLLELGVTTIWVTPVYENIKSHNNSEPYHYYWPLNFERVDSRLLDGTHLPESVDMSTFGSFVDLCEAKGMKVVLDMVVNHAGYGAKEHFDSSWFNVGGTDDIKKELYGLPEFNHDNPEVLDYFINNIEDWIIKGNVTNIRMDTVKHVEPKFWYYFKSQIRGEYPHVCLIGEVLYENKDDVSKLLEYQNYHDFDSIFDFPLCTALRSTLIYDESLKNWIARPRLDDEEPLGVLDDDNPGKGGYRDANMLITLLDNHDLERRIMSHARTKHPGGGAGLDLAIRVTKLCLGALFTMRGIPQIYYGTEVGLEGWKAGDDRDLRRDFPWHVIGNNNHPRQQYHKEYEIYEWTRDLIRLRKGNEALKYGTTITLWSDDLIYAFLRIATDDVALVIINNSYLRMPNPIHLDLNMSVIPKRVVKMITGGLKHWKTGQALTVQNGKMLVKVDGKTIDIFCRDVS